MIKVDDIRMELVQVREAIDTAEMMLEVRESEGIRKQLVDLRKQEAMLSARIMEWSV